MTTTTMSSTALAEARPTDVVRFLEQATFGPTPELVRHVQDIGFEGFLAEQFGGPILSYPEMELWPASVPSTCTGTCPRDNYTMYPLQAMFFRNAVTGPDQVRQRLVFALDQIFVTSAIDADLRLPSRMVYFLRTLSENAYGNFRDLLYNVTLSPAMGRYLDMAGNSKASPNENYARELLQLMAIGLYELNDDGTWMVDAKGSPIPSFSQEIVVALSRVLTGWNFAAAPAPGVTNYRDPMVLTQANHDVGAKVLLGGVTLAANRNGGDDLNAAIDLIFKHHNVGPFIGRQLIQKMVTSNPSPAYVRRVATVFNNNGLGVRGDMKAVVRAVLLDPEARDPDPPPAFGKLKEPVQAITNLLRAFSSNEATTDFVLGDSYLPANLRTGQDVFRSPSVFNFYPPDNVAPGTGLLGPEFALQSTSTTLARTNLVYSIVYKAMATSADRPKGTWVEFPDLEALAGDPAALVETLNQRLLHGTMSEAFRSIVAERVASVAATDRRGRARKAVYLVVSSSAYQVQR